MPSVDALPLRGARDGVSRQPAVECRGAPPVRRLSGRGPGGADPCYRVDMRPALFNQIVVEAIEPRGVGPEVAASLDRLLGSPSRPARAIDRTIRREARPWSPRAGQERS